MTSSPRETVPVQWLVLTIQAAIKAVPVPSDRTKAWGMFQDLIKQAQSSSPDRLPWQDPGEITGLAAAKGGEILVKVLRELPDKERLRNICVKELDRLDRVSASDKGKPGKGVERVCSRPGCGRTFWSSQPNARTCSDACRSAVYKARKKAQASHKATA